MCCLCTVRKKHDADRRRCPWTLEKNVIKYPFPQSPVHSSEGCSGTLWWPIFAQTGRAWGGRTAQFVECPVCQQLWVTGFMQEVQVNQEEKEGTNAFLTQAIVRNEWETCTKTGRKSPVRLVLVLRNCLLLSGHPCLHRAGPAAINIP
jgi:hypothetical protein